MPFYERTRPFEIRSTAVPRSDLGHRFRVQPISERMHFAKRLLEPTWRDDLKDRCGLVACVPERVPLPAGLEEEISSLREDLLFTQ